MSWALCEIRCPFSHNITYKKSFPLIRLITAPRLLRLQETLKLPSIQALHSDIYNEIESYGTILDICNIYVTSIAHKYTPYSSYVFSYR